MLQEVVIEDAADFASYLDGIIRTGPEPKYLGQEEFDQKIGFLWMLLCESPDSSARWHSFRTMILLVDKGPASVQASLQLPWMSDSIALDATDRDSERDALDVANSLIHRNDSLKGYWNAAAAWRDVRVAYARRHCHYSSNDCFHVLYVGLLKKLRERAHVEIRRGVLLAVGRQFPMELVNLIHQYSLQAEDVPESIRFFDDATGVYGHRKFSSEWSCENLIWDVQAKDF